MAKAFTPEQLADRTFFLTTAFIVAIVAAIQVILWI